MKKYNLGFALGFWLIVAIAAAPQTQQNVNNLQADSDVLVDCYPDINSYEQGCLDRGCIWSPSDVDNAPWCVFPSGYGYEVNGDETPTDLGFDLSLTRKDGQTSSPYSPDIDNIRVQVEFWTKNIVRIRFDDPNNQRYEVPLALAMQRPTVKPSEVDYDVTYTNDPQFGITVTRISTGTVIFNTNHEGFIFSDQFLQTTTSLPSSNLYGLGEQNQMQYQHDLNWKLWTAFSRDEPPNHGDTCNLYGVQPFYLNVENDGNANGVLLYNSNAMEFNLQPAPAITYRTVGGILDFYIYLGPTPEEVVQQHMILIGLPTMPSYWYLGFQLCRYGYKSTDEIRGVDQSMIDNEIPFDVQWTDIDAFDGYRDFSINPNGFSDLSEFVDELHKEGLRYVPMVDCAISSDSSLSGQYPPMDDGLAMNVFVKNPDGSNLVGQVWPGYSYFPDFSHTNATAYWSKEHQYYWSTLGVEFDGVWNDMNEPSNFVDGSVSGCTDNSYNHPPYATHICGSGTGLYQKTICMDSTQQYGLTYNVHSMYGIAELKTSYDVLQTIFPGKRPNILTRSNFVGSGKYAAHWLGDNNSGFDSMKDSIPGILQYNLFGVPVVGADICGFNGETTVELCIRWMQLGSFYSFSRNHNSGNTAQDPPSLGDEVVQASKLALNERYRLLPYLYTLLHEANTVGGTVLRPLVHEFPQDSNTWSIGNQFLWGPALYISPVLDQGLVTVDVYLPQARWYNYYDGVEMTMTGMTMTMDAPLDGPIVLHVRGGYIIPTQEPGINTDLSRKNPFGLIVALDENGAASGSQYWDDGESLTTFEDGAFNIHTFSLTTDGTVNTLQITATSTGGGDQGAPLTSIKFYGVASAPTTITVDGAALDSNSFSYDENKALTLNNLNLALPGDHTVTF